MPKLTCVARCERRLERDGAGAIELPGLVVATQTVTCSSPTRGRNGRLGVWDARGPIRKGQWHTELRDRARLGDALLLIGHDGRLAVHHRHRGAARRGRSDGAAGGDGDTGTRNEALSAGEAGCPEASWRLGSRAHSAAGLPGPGDVLHGRYAVHGAGNEAERVSWRGGVASQRRLFPPCFFRGHARVREGCMSAPARSPC